MSLATAAVAEPEPVVPGHSTERAEKPTVASLALVLALLTGGIIVSVLADRRDARAGKPPRQARLTPREDP